MCSKFDVGIYTVITSVSPLRVYVFDGEALLRFCPADYYPFDPAILDKYVVGDDYTPTWEVRAGSCHTQPSPISQMPSLKRYHTDHKFTFKESLNAYLREKKYANPDRIWTQMYDTIRQVFFAKIDEIRPLVNNYAHQW